MRCKEVFYCSKFCKLKVWNVRYREECVCLMGGGVKIVFSCCVDSFILIIDFDVLFFFIIFLGF